MDANVFLGAIAPERARHSRCDLKIVEERKLISTFTLLITHAEIDTADLLCCQNTLLSRIHTVHQDHNTLQKCYLVSQLGVSTSQMQDFAFFWAKVNDVCINSFLQISALRITILILCTPSSMSIINTLNIIHLGTDPSEYPSYPLESWIFYC